MAGNIRGLIVEIGGDTTKLGKALEAVQKKSKDLSGELGQINRLLKMDPGNTDLLAQKQKVLAEAVANTKEKLETLQEAERQVQKQFERGEVSEEQYRALQREIIGTAKKLENYEKAAQETAEAAQRLGKGTKEAEEGLDDSGDEAKKSAKEVDKFADSADKAEKSGGKMGGTLKGIAVGGLKVVGAACAAAIAGLTAAAESTREYRTEMGKLDAAFTSSGHSADTASSTYKTLQGIIGETDQSVEAAQQIALLADSEKDAAAWAEQAAGVVGKFGDALQPETFFESANMSMKLGEATGAYTQMLEGCGMSVEDFNAGLAACKTEAEKQAYMLQVTEKALGSAGDAYRENNAELIRANEASEAWTSSLAGVGGAIEPIITDIKTMGASLLSDLIPGVEKLAGSFRGLLSGDAGAAAGVGEALSGLITDLLGKVTEVAPQLATAAVSLIGSLATSLIGMVPRILEVGIEIALALIQGLTTAGPQVIQSIVGIIPQLVDALILGVPLLVQAGIDLLLALANAIPAALPVIVAAVPQLVLGLVNALLGGDMIGQLLSGAVTFLCTIVEAIPQLIAQLLPQVPAIVQAICSGLIQNIPVLLAGAIQLLNCIVDAIPVLLETLLPQIPTIISQICASLGEMAPVLLGAAITLFFELLKAIPALVVALGQNLPQILRAILAGLSAIPQLIGSILANVLPRVGAWISQMVGKAIQLGSQFLASVVSFFSQLPGRIGTFLTNAISRVVTWAVNLAAKGRAAASKLVTTVVNGVKGLPGKMLSVGTDLVKGIGQGITSGYTWLKNRITEFVGDVTSFIKRVFKIGSPSRLMADEVGKWLPRGIGVGIDEDAHYATDALSDLGDDMVDAANPELGGLTFERDLNYINRAHGGGIAASMARDNAALLAKLDGIYERLGRLQVVLDSGATVGGLIDGIDSALSARQILRARGV